jgi:hypothetical protein
MIGSALWQSRRRRPRRADQPKVQEDPFLTEVLGVKRLNSEEPGYRIEVSPKHTDLPALIAECMDTLAAMGWDPARAAIRLEVSASQIVKLLKKHSPALGAVNDERMRRGLHTLK